MKEVNPTGIQSIWAADEDGPVRSDRKVNFGDIQRDIVIFVQIVRSKGTEVESVDG